MRRVVASSIDALDPTTQLAFAALAVFPSRFNYGAARAVIGAAAIDSLCEHSILQSTPLRDGGAVLRWAAVVRQYAAEFAAGRVDLDLCRRAHAAHFAQQVAGAVIPGSSLALRDDDLDDYVAAAQHTDQAPAVIELTLAIDAIFERRARHRERIVLITNNLQRIGDAATSMQLQHAALLLSLGKAQRQVGDFVAANLHFEQARAVGAKLNDSLIQALAICRQAELVATGGDTSLSRLMLRDAEALVRQNNDGNQHSWAITAEIEVLFQTGHSLRREGLLDDAARAYQKSYALATALGNVEWLAALNYELGVIDLFHNKYSDARAVFNAALQMAKDSDLVQIQAATHTALGITAQAEGELQVALDHHVRAIQIFRDIGHPHREGSALYSLGCTYLELNDAPSALVVLRRAGVLIQSVGAYRYDALIKMALALVYHGLHEQADASASLAAANTAAQFCPTEPALHAALSVAHFLVHGAAHERAMHIEQARALVAQAPGDDPQFVLRMLARFAAPTNPASTLTYHEASATLLFPDDVSVSLQTRAPLRRIVERLFELRLEQPGEDVGFDALIAVGWPNEQIALDAARNRLHVALSALRRLGLRDAIKSGQHGYHIDPLLTIRWRSRGG
jgi:tetratricopeptide (TPR) repeat protein